MVTRTTIAQLAAPEREELERVIAGARGKKFGTDRYVSDAGDSSVPYLFVLLLAIVGIVAFQVSYGFGMIPEYWRFVGMGFPRTLIHPALGVQLAVVAGIWSAWMLVQIYGRHGWAVTSFGFVRVRGKKLRVVHWRDVIRLSRRQVQSGSGIKSRRFTIVTLTTRDGSALESYAGSLWTATRERLPADATVLE
ncbi:MAG TPA: hypothetical protein VFQ53_04310 [Kofleriaceae bacterium]|nr:hypothetical protein [Kofleriaceae bacterium]